MTQNATRSDLNLTIVMNVLEIYIAIAVDSLLLFVGKVPKPSSPAAA